MMVLEAQMTRTWYLVQTKPNAHHIAERNLKRQGCDVFLPLIKQTRRSGQRFSTEVRPLFPGYLFVGLRDGIPSWRTLNSTHGVSRAVSFDGQYRPVPNQLISTLQAGCDAECVFQTKRALSAGDVVKIQKGPFASFLAEVESLAPEQRVWVLFDLMGQKSRLLLDQTDIHPA